MTEVAHLYIIITLLVGEKLQLAGKGYKDSDYTVVIAVVH